MRPHTEAVARRYFRSIAVLALLAVPLACDEPLDLAHPEAPQLWRDVSAGDLHTCATALDGHAWCWGYEATARLGYISEGAPCTGDFCSEPVPVVGGAAMEGIEAGEAHNCGISGGAPLCWGWGWRGQLGDGGTLEGRCVPPGGRSAFPCSLEPVPVALGFDVRDVAVGGERSCAVTRAGDGYCWGFNHMGQLGTGEVGGATWAPTEVAGDHVWDRISLGPSHGCGLDAAGEIWCWGAGDAGRLGHGSVSSSPVPVQVEDDRVTGNDLRWADLDAGVAHTCGVTQDGKAYCWGLGGRGRLGDGSGVSFPFPVRARVPGVPNESQPVIVAVSAGGTHSCLLTAEGELYCFGENDNGQLGDGSTIDRLRPSRVVGDRVWARVSAGTRHTCAIDVDQALYCWGDGSFGRLGTGDLSDRLTPRRIPSG